MTALWPCVGRPELTGGERGPARIRGSGWALQVTLRKIELFWPCVSKLTLPGGERGSQCMRAIVRLGVSHMADMCIPTSLLQMPSGLCRGAILSEDLQWFAQYSRCMLCCRCPLAGNL